MKLRLNLYDLCLLLNPSISTSKLEKREYRSTRYILKKYGLSKEDLKRIATACKNGKFTLLAREG